MEKRNYLFEPGNFLRITVPGNPDFVQYGLLLEAAESCGLLFDILYTGRDCFNDAFVPTTCSFQRIVGRDGRGFEDRVYRHGALVVVNSVFEEPRVMFLSCVIEDIAHNEPKTSVQPLLDVLPTDKYEISLFLEFLVKQLKTKFVHLQGQFQRSINEIDSWLSKFSPKEKK